MIILGCFGGTPILGNIRTEMLQPFYASNSAGSLDPIGSGFQMRPWNGWLGDDGGLEENFRSYGMIDDGCSEAYGWLVGWLRLVVYCVPAVFLGYFRHWQSPSPSYRLPRMVNIQLIYYQHKLRWCETYHPVFFWWNTHFFPFGPLWTSCDNLCEHEMVCNLILETINASVMMCISVLLRHKKFEFFFGRFWIKHKTAWWFQTCFDFHPYRGKNGSILTDWVGSTTI